LISPKILQESFTCPVPKSAIKTDGFTVFFALLGSARVKAFRKMLVKSSPDLFDFARFDQLCRAALTQPLFRHGSPGKHDQGRDASETGQPDDRSESSESCMLRPLSLEPGRQGEEHVHVHGLHPHRHEDDPRLLRGTGRPRGDGVGHQSGRKQKKCSG